MSFIYQHEATIRLSLFLGGFSLLALWEWLKPKRELTQVKFKRWFNNIALVICSTLVVRIILPTAAIAIAYLVEQKNLGFANYVELSFWPKVFITFILLDLIIYFQHAMFHALPIMWRIHRVHHSDLDCDVTTGLRFHPLEILLSILIKFSAIIALGAPVLTVILFEVVLNLMSMFTHSNIYLNHTFERILRWVFVTPDMHRIHHSTQENETNSNFSFNLSLWDRIFATYMAEPKAGQQGMTIGLEQFRKPNWQGFSGLISMPFSTRIKGYAINYRDTKNADELAMAKEIALKSQEKAKIATELASYMEAINQHALVTVADYTGKIIQANDKFCEISGYSQEELLGSDHRIVNSTTHPKTFFAELWDTIASGDIWHGEICDQSKDGKLYWLDTTIVPIKDENGEIERYISFRIDITDRKRHESEIQKAYQSLAEANSQLEKISRIDGLTKIANRRYFDEILKSESSRLSRTSIPLSLILCDIDYFKDYNDTYGHPAGDSCLQRVAQSIESSFSRAGDLVARYGGEEFAVILSNVDRETALTLAESLRKNIEKLKVEHNSSEVAKVVTISVGVTTLIPDENTSIPMIIDKADKALYLAKRAGRNNVQYV